MDQSYFRVELGISFASFAIAIWASVWTPHQKEIEKYNQHLAFIEKYPEGWNYYCNEIFNASAGFIPPSGVLYAGGNQYSESWCVGLRQATDAESSYKSEGAGISSDFSSVADEEENGFNRGWNEARERIFQEVPYLCYGAECISAESEFKRLMDLKRRQDEGGF